MKHLTLIAILAASPAAAGSFNPALEDPTVTPRACFTLFGLPCHVKQGGNDPLLDDDWTPPTAPKKTPTPQPPVECSMNEWSAGAQYANGSKPKKECA